MKISVDGGGLGAKKGERYGNYVFSENLIKALTRFDKSNHYVIYTLDKLKPRFAWSKIRLSLEELKEKKDVFLALNQAVPLYVSGKIVTFCHGFSYYFFPKNYSLRDNIRLRNQLDEMIFKSDTIIVSSLKVKKELESIAIKYSKKNKVKVIPFGIPFDMAPHTLHVKRNTLKDYFLYVGMDHPIKNIELLKKAFGEIKKLEKFKRYKLIMATENVARSKLIRLYQGASALLTASYYESFNLPVLEALSQGTPVIGLESAIIPEFKPYVQTAHNLKGFINQMKNIRPLNLQIVNKLRKEFNWKNYVEKLVKLY
ncbi:hypothetical protein HZA76_04775 [Candidatus Roizmanbacteria bacterium]|nr:hypothetical protein [Candidatus Roizmanbacteria bacterium]